MTPPEILSPDLPLTTALRAAVERGQVLQTNGRVSLIAPKLLKGFTRIYARVEEDNREIA